MTKNTAIHWAHRMRCAWAGTQLALPKRIRVLVREKQWKLFATWLRELADGLEKDRP